MPLICPLCSYEQTVNLNLNLSGLLRHIELIHSHQLSFSITCGLNGCVRSFKNFRVFWNHAYSMHGGDAALSSECVQADDHTDNSITEAVTPEISTSQNVSMKELQMSAALFLMGMKENFKLTQVALQGVIDGVTGLTQGRLSTLHSRIQSILAAAPSGIPASITDDICRLFDENGEFFRPFLGLETEHQQSRFYRTHFNFVVSYMYPGLELPVRLLRFWP